MADDLHNKSMPPDDFTIPSRQTVSRRPRGMLDANSNMQTAAQLASQIAASTGIQAPPLLIQHFLDGAVDLDKELVTRFPNMPLMSVIRARVINGKTRSGMAVLSTQDGAASVVVEVNTVTRDAFFTFTFGGMIGLRFVISRLSDMDRAHWLEPMRRELGEIAFLWNQSRWENDYLICAAHQHYTNMFAFSTQHTEAAIRMTNEVSGKMIDWIDALWREEPPVPPPRPKTQNQW